MSLKFSNYTEVFFWDYKRMDNTNYNFQILEALCKIKKVDSSNKLLNKPIIIITVAIIESILYDFVQRVTEHTNERIPNLDPIAISDTKNNKTLDVFGHLIEHIKDKNLLRAKSTDSIYDDLDFLKQARNRIHIENMYQLSPKNEWDLWTEDNIKMATKTLERVCEVLCHVYPRPDREFVSITDFPRPWG